MKLNLQPWVILVLAAILAAVGGCGPRPATEGKLPGEGVRLQLLDWFSRAPADGKFTVEKKPLYSEALCRRFYADRGFKPAWCDERGLTPLAEALFHELQGAHRDGLNPDDYHTGMLFHLWIEEKRSGSRATPREMIERRAAIDLLLTDGYLLYLMHLGAGRVALERRRADLPDRRPGLDPVADAQRAADGEDLETVRAACLPKHPDYAAIKAALMHYRHLSDTVSWPDLPAGPPLQPGDMDARADLLRYKLSVLGDLAGSSPAASAPVDPPLLEALRRYQARHSLAPSGEVDTPTLQSLNRSLEERVRQLAVNLERWRWMERDLGERYIWVNIPGFDLRAIEKGREILKMKVVVGQHYRKTPVFSSKLRYLILNPTWEMPANLVLDRLWTIKHDPDFFRKNRISVTEYWGEQEREVDPVTVSWAKVPVADFYRRYHFRQAPGEDNPLGRIKIMFPNEYNVYLHDTSKPELFNKSIRDFSSGCIRLEKPLDLAALLLRDKRMWTKQRLVNAAQFPVEQKLRFRPWPIYIVYFTCWTEADGTLRFGHDLYRHDQQIETGFNEPPLRMP